MGTTQKNIKTRQLLHPNIKKGSDLIPDFIDIQTKSFDYFVEQGIKEELKIFLQS